MKLFLILASILTIQAEDVTTNCTGVTINNTYYEPEILHEDLDRPYLLAVDYSTNILYFSYSVDDGEDGSRTARLNLNTKEFADIKGVNNGFAQTVDQKHHEIYIGGSDGIYKYNYGEDKADLISEKGVNIWNIYFKDVLYFSQYPSQFLFTQSNQVTSRFKDLEDTKVDNFVIDSDDNMFFTNATGLYSQKKNTKTSVLYKKCQYTGIRGLTIDREGKVYACLQDGIYHVDKNLEAVEKILDIDNAFGVAFDIDNNIVYANSTMVIRLKPSRNKSC